MIKIRYNEVLDVQMTCVECLAALASARVVSRPAFVAALPTFTQSHHVGLVRTNTQASYEYYAWYVILPD
jgi:hypothetical protein